MISEKVRQEDIETYSLVALDIDGTMIGEDRVVQPDLVKAVSDVQAMGAVVSIATGRTLVPALRVAEQSGVLGPVICFQGAMTFDQFSESVIRHIRLEENIARQSIECLTSAIPEVMMFLDDEVWVEQRAVDAAFKNLNLKAAQTAMREARDAFHQARRALSCAVGEGGY